MRTKCSPSPLEDMFDSLRSQLADFDQLRGFMSAFRQFERAMTRRNAEVVADDGSDGGLTLDIGGEALAVGDGSRTRGKVDADIRDLGDVRIARGEAAFSALSTGDRDDTVIADTDAYADISGADFVFTYVVESDGGRSGRNGSWAGSETRLEVIAIDIEGFDFAQGPMEFSRERSGCGEGRGMRSEGGRHRGFQLEDHVAEVSATADAWGDAAYTGTFVDSFADDGMSTVAAYVTGAIA